MDSDSRTGIFQRSFTLPYCRGPSSRVSFRLLSHVLLGPGIEDPPPWDYTHDHRRDVPIRGQRELRKESQSKNPLKFDSVGSVGRRTRGRGPSSQQGPSGGWFRSPLTLLSRPTIHPGLRSVYSHHDSPTTGPQIPRSSRSRPGDTLKNEGPDGSTGESVHL